MPELYTRPSPLGVALLGMGTVGGALVGALADPDRVPALRGVRIVSVGVRDPLRGRGVQLDPDVVLTDDLAAAARHPEADVLVELMGGLEPAGSVVADALRRGMPVVTANKALLSQRGASLETAAREGEAALRFEAAVGGGTPVLSPLVRDLAANRLRAVRGIVNGTTNHILTAMQRDGTGYPEALADAQSRGYAEADPSADVEGLDAVHKLVVLVRLAFGVWLDPHAISRSAPSLAGEGRTGVTGVQAEEIAAADALGLRLKLVARATRAAPAARTTGPAAPAGGEPGVSDARDIDSLPVDAEVSLAAVPRASSIGSTDGVTNVVEFRGDPIGVVAFRGPGAGGPATASAVLGDILAIGRGEGSTWPPLAANAPPADTATHREAVAPDDGLRRAGCWFYVRKGEGTLTARVSLAHLRSQLSRDGVSPETTLYPVLEDD